MPGTKTLILFAAVLSASAGALFAAPRDRVLAKVDDSQRVFLNGGVHPKAQAQYDRGVVAPSLGLTHLTLNFKLSANQQASLDQLLADQRNPASANYHKWLTPEDYAARFGLSDADLAQAASWLQSQGLTVTGTAQARNFVTFDGVASNIQKAFRTELHNYVVDGEVHFANVSEPSVPAALEPVVRGVQGLHDFRLKPRMTTREIRPLDTSSSGNHYVAPDDFAAIYDVAPLYAAGYNGAGQKLVIVGQTDIRTSDLTSFQSMYKLPAQLPQQVLVPNSQDPGVSKNDLGEADLDLEWSGAVARGATIIYVYSTDVIASMQYAIDQNLAPIVSMSYGSCEPSNSASDATNLRSMAQQAVAQGITWFNASGDSGAADCSGQPGTSATALAVDLPASVPEITGVGGTEFAEGSGTYWSAANNANSASALSHIPETSWNDSAIDGSPSASGGGASIYFTKPAWQTGPGVPSDGARDVPDVSMNASADHDGYDSISGGKLYSVGGTSAPTPMFAGIAAILNQYLVQNGRQAAPGLGNINPQLYTLAQTAPNAFHDIATGNNMVTAACPRRGCVTPPASVGFSAGPGYDQVTGLGSLDVYNFVLAWSSGAPVRLTPRISVSASSTSLSAGQTTTLTATVASSNGTLPTGSITFQSGSATLGSAQLSGSGDTSSATLTLAASQLSPGDNNITAQYNSDNSTFDNTAATVTITVSATGSVSLAIGGIADGASFQRNYAPGEVLTIFGAGLAGSAQVAGSVPLPSSMGGVTVSIGGMTAPLYAVSPGQLNVQIPYATPLHTNENLVIRYGVQSATYVLTLNASAPAIFTDQNGAPVPNGSAGRGSTATLYITGAGAVSPTVATGAAPASGTSIANLPKPVEAVSVTVGGVTAPVIFEGIPAGLVGVVQINFQVPASVSPGVQPVVVTVGNASSVEANLTVQ